MKGCEAGCNHFTCGSIGHHPDCKHYDGSMQQMIDNKNAEIEKLKTALRIEAISHCKLNNRWLSGELTEVPEGSIVRPEAYADAVISEIYDSLFPIGNNRQ